MSGSPEAGPSRPTSISAAGRSSASRSIHSGAFRTATRATTSGRNQAPRRARRAGTSPAFGAPRRDPACLLAFQKPELEGHEGNEGHEELLARRGWPVLGLNPTWRLA